MGNILAKDLLYSVINISAKHPLHRYHDLRVSSNGLLSMRNGQYTVSILIIEGMADYRIVAQSQDIFYESCH